MDQAFRQGFATAETWFDDEGRRQKVTKYRMFLDDDEVIAALLATRGRRGS